MKYSVERVDWKDQGAAVTDLLCRAFPNVPADRYTWLHEHNPARPAALWLARDSDGQPIGTAAVHARRMTVDGRTVRVGQAADFAVEPSARVFGPAVALQRAVVAACDSGEFPFLYGFPNHAAKGVFERIGYDYGRTRRLARPLRARPYVERSGHLASVARFVAAPLDLAIRLASRDTYRFALRSARLEPVERFDDSFDVFWARMQAAHGIIGQRDSEFMNWRYARWPTKRYDCVVLRRGSELATTIVSYRIANVVYIAEMLALDTTAFDAALVPFLHAQRRAGASAVSFILLGDGHFAARLATYGFFPREVQRTMMLYVPSRSPLRHQIDRADRWCLFEGDVL